MRFKGGPEACTEVCRVDLREKRDCGGGGKDKKVTVSTAHVGDGEKFSTAGPRVCAGSREAGLRGRGRLE